jgi:bacteriochlorophyllide a dehydrogenase
MVVCWWVLHRNKSVKMRKKINEHGIEGKQRMQTSAIIFPQPNEVDVVQFDLPVSLAEGEVLTETLLSGVSSGTETRVLAGLQPGTTFPLIPGYENVGRVIEIGAGVHSLKIGDIVFHSGSQNTGPYGRAWGGQMAHAVIEANEALLIPPGLPLEDAIYAKVAGIARHGIWRADVKAGEQVVIVGQGLIGHLAAQISVALGAEVTVLDVVPERLAAAEEAGVTRVINPAEVDAEQALRESVGMPDVVVDATGNAAILNQSLRYLPPKPWGKDFVTSPRFLILGSYPAEIMLDYRLLFEREPDVIISRDNLAADRQAVVVMMVQGSLRPSLLNAQVLSFEQAPEGYSRLLARQAHRVLFTWSK